MPKMIFGVVLGFIYFLGFIIKPRSQSSPKTNKEFNLFPKAESLFKLGLGCSVCPMQWCQQKVSRQDMALSYPLSVVGSRGIFSFQDSDCCLECLGKRNSVGFKDIWSSYLILSNGYDIWDVRYFLLDAGPSLGDINLWPFLELGASCQYMGTQPYSLGRSLSSLPWQLCGLVPICVARLP